MSTIPEEHPERSKSGNPALSKIIERNIRTMTHLRLRASRAQGAQDRAAASIASFSGSMLFIYLHVAWFFIWMVVNSGYFGVEPFDPFPYGHLATIVSLEAIFLSTLVLITQKRLRDEVERRESLDLHVGLLAEHELTRVLRMLHAIQEKLGIENNEASELEDLEMETRPQDVLAEIARLYRRFPPDSTAATGRTR